MLDNREKATYGRSLAGALRALGPTLRTDALDMLRDLNLSDDEAASTIAYALRAGILEAEGEVLRAGPEAPIPGIIGAGTSART